MSARSAASRRAPSRSAAQRRTCWHGFSAVPTALTSAGTGPARCRRSRASTTSEGAQMERTVQTADGRTLAVQENGDTDGMPVLAHMGSPNSRHMYAPISADAAARGLRLISYDRPGYGGSTPSPGRSVADCAGAVRAICAALGIDRLRTWGISGGGPHVLACATLLPDLVVAAASLASTAPYGAEGLDWYEGMGQD